MGTLTAWCEERSIPYQGVPVQKIKIFATGKGNAHKDDVVIAVEDWGYYPANDDEADAIALCRLVCVDAERVSVKMSDLPICAPAPLARAD